MLIIYSLTLLHPTNEWIYLYECACILIYLYECAYSYICMSAHTHIFVWVPILIYLYECAYWYICMSAHTHIYVWVRILIYLLWSAAVHEGPRASMVRLKLKPLLYYSSILRCRGEGVGEGGLHSRVGRYFNFVTKFSMIAVFARLAILIG